jgi:hypothetical protein
MLGLTSRPIVAVRWRNLWSLVHGQRIVVSYHLALSVAEGDCAIRVLGHQRVVELATNLKSPQAFALRRIGWISSSHVRRPTARLFKTEASLGHSRVRAHLFYRLLRGRK